MQPALHIRLFRLAIGVAVLILVVFLARYPIKMIPAFNTYSEAVDKNGLHPGALYYSDVPVTLDSERYTRSAVKAVDDKHLQERASRNAQ